MRTAQEIIKLAAELPGYYKTRNAQFLEDEKFFTKEFKIPMPKGKKALILPTGPMVVINGINHLSRSYPKCTVPRRANTDTAQDDAEAISNYLNAQWYMLQSQQSKSITRDALFYAFVRGPSVFKVLYDPDAWPDEPEEPEMPEGYDGEVGSLPVTSREQFIATLDSFAEYEVDRDNWKHDFEEWEAQVEVQLPYSVQVRDPQFVFPEPGVDPPSYVIEIYESTWAYIKKAWPEMNEVGEEGESQFPSMNDTDKLQWVEYWDKDSYWYGIYNSKRGMASKLDNWREAVPVKRHNWGFVPYVIWGGWSSPLEKPEFQYQSVYYAIKDLLGYESALFSQRAHIIRKYAWPALKVKSDRKDFKFNPEEGAINYFREGEDAIYMEWSSPLPILEIQLDAVQDYIAGSTTPEVLRGTAKARSGYALAQQASLAQAFITPYAVGLAYAVQQVNERILRLIDRVIEQPVRIWGKSGGEMLLAEIGPENIRGYYRNLVDVDVTLPVDEIQNARSNAELYDRRIISRLTAAERSGIENPLQEQARLAAEDIIEHPAMQEARAVKAALDWGIDIAAYIGAQQGVSPMQSATQKKKRRFPSPTPTPPAQGTVEETDLVERQYKAPQGARKRNLRRKKR
uniref:Portal protein n=1 Tax=viral metagenome TaxID=1070528 RepID=A0A6H1ZM05_9ZZZZ